MSTSPRKQIWLFAALLLFCTGGAAVLRLPQLGLRPMHGDEAVHTFRFETLWQKGEYQYDPYEYHGPTLYYLTLPVVWLSDAKTFGETREWMYRLAPALCGVALIPLLWLMRGGLGRTAAVCAAVLTALSPAMAFYSRYYIQEPLLVLFTFGAIAAGWRYIQTKHTGWALAAGACLGLMHATKETCILAWGAMAGALIFTWLWERQAAWRVQAALAARQQSRAVLSPENRRADTPALLGESNVPPVEKIALPSKKFNPAILLGALLLGLVFSTLLYSVFLKYPRGALDSWRTYTLYLDRAAGHGSDGLHHHPWHYYLKMLLYTRYGREPLWSEAPLLVLALIGAIAAFSRRASMLFGSVSPALPRFLAVYTLLLTIAYSVIPYKTPWCMLGFLHGMILLAGCGVAVLLHWLRTVALARIGAAVWPWLVIPAAVCLLGVCGLFLGRQAYQANFRFYADNRNPYVYAHPVMDVVHLAGVLEGVAAADPRGHALLIQVVTPDYWPLPWYLRRFAHIGYWEQPPATLDVSVATAPATTRPEAAGLPPAIVITSPELQPAVEAKLRGAYHSGYYGLRHGVALLVYVEQSAWDAYVNSRTSSRNANEP